MDKVQKHMEICKKLNAIYERKNADYGDSFHKSYEDEGMAMPRIRIGDKYNRLCSITRSKDIKVTDESVVDTLLDLANYAIMTVMELTDE